MSSAAAEFADDLNRIGADADAYNDDEDRPRTVVVQKAGPVPLPEFLDYADRHGYFVFGEDATEFTFAAYADCEWKSNPTA